MIHEGSLVLHFPFGPLPLALNPLQTVYSQAGKVGERERIEWCLTWRPKCRFLGHARAGLEGHRKVCSAWVLKRDFSF